VRSYGAYDAVCSVSAVIFAEETDFGVGDTGTAEIAPSLGGKCLQVTEQRSGK